MKFVVITIAATVFLLAALFTNEPVAWVLGLFFGVGAIVSRAFQK